MMARSPAPIEIVREKLDAPDAATRIVALQHVGAHGTAARSLAVKVLELYGDPDQIVRQYAWMAFPRISKGAVEGVPILLGMNDGNRSAAQLSQIARDLGSIGPAAIDALPMLREAYRSNSNNGNFLRAVLSIAPDDRQTIDILVEKALSPAFSDRMMPAMDLSRLDGLAIDRAFERIGAAANHPDPARREAAAMLLGLIAGKRPNEAIVLLRAFLSDPVADGTMGAFRGLTKLPPPIPADLVASVIRVAESNDGIRRSTALDVLDELGVAAASAQPILLDIIRANVRSIPVAGEQGWPAGHLARAAVALARNCPTDAAVSPLIAWLEGVPDVRPPPSSWMHWSLAGDVVTALAILAPSDPAVHAATLAAISASRRDLDSHSSGVVDFERRIREAFGRFPDPEKMFQQAEELGMARVDPYADQEIVPEHETPGDLPDFPPTVTEGQIEQLRSVPTAAPLAEETQRKLDGLIRQGLEDLGLAPSARPLEVAKAVEGALARARYAHKTIEAEQASALGVTFGEAVRRLMGWEWRAFRDGGEWELAIVSPDETHVHLPLRYIARQVQSGRDTTATLLFNMLAAGQLPPSSAGALASIG